MENTFNSEKNLTIITNSVEILLDLPVGNNWKVISTGGIYHQDSMSYRSVSSVTAIEKYHVDLAVISCKGIDIQKGITDTSEENAEIKKAFIRNAKKRILAVDHTKFDKVSFVEVLFPLVNME